MAKFHVRYSVERRMVVEADNESQACEIAEMSPEALWIEDSSPFEATKVEEGS